MRSVHRCWVPIALVAAAIVRVAPAHACACCTEPGQRMEQSAPLGSYEAGEMARMRFGSSADLFLTAAGFEGVSGIADPATRYNVSVTTDGKTFTFAMKTKDGKSGTIAFSPKTLESFYADIRDGKRGAEPLLYKEWRVSAPMLATGVFSPAVADPGGPPNARLVLQGRGNSCTDATQFTHWTLVVSSKKVRFTFFGDLRAPSAPSP